MADASPNKAAMDRLRAVIAAYGADPARWPEGDRQLASPEMLAAPELKTHLDDATVLDRALARASHPAVPIGAAERLTAKVDGVPGNVVTIAHRAPTRRHANRLDLPRRLAVSAALAASLAFGLYLGAIGESNWLTPLMSAEESPEYLSAELDVLDGTLQLFEDNMEP